jgi:two-component system sensor histidine kinase DesK
VTEGTPANRQDLDDAVAGLRRNGRLRLALSLGSLILLVPALVAFAFAGPPAERVASLAPAVAAFIIIVVWTVAAPTARLSQRALVATVMLTLLAVVVMLIDPVSPWLVLFLYPIVAAGWLASVHQAVIAIVTVTIFCEAAGWSVLAIPANRIERPLEFALIGFGSLALSRLVIVNRQLALARAEMARLGASDERLRIARDLHDLLGHGLSVISLKAQLAGRLLPGAPERAAAEVADIELVSRRALEDVRAAVSGYRRLRLDNELVGARFALEAAGVTTEIEHQAGGLPDDVDEALAWSVREGATNVIRHARARTAVIRTRREDRAATLEVVNDEAPAGSQAEPAPSIGSERGSGLVGLAERAGALGGRVEAAPKPEGGYRLAVIIPLPGGAS